MAGYLQLIGYTLLLYLCIYGVISRICKCIEHHTEWKYSSEADIDLVKNHPPGKSSGDNRKKEES